MEKEHVLSVIKNHWNKKAAEFNIDRNADEIGRWEKVLSEFLGRDKSKSVVDIGTGTGFLANITGKLGHPTIGMDLSREMLKYAVKQGETCASSAMYIEGNASELPFVDDSIDYIVNARFIWTLLEPEITLREWFRVIRRGGGYFVIQYNEGRNRYNREAKEERILSR